MSNISLVKSMNFHEQMFDEKSMNCHEPVFNERSHKVGIEQSQDVVFARKPIDRQIVNRNIVKSCIDGEDVPSRFIEEQTRRSCRVRFEDESVGTAGGK